MNQKKVYLAVDLGAGSGRVLAGEFDGHRIDLKEMNRFENTPIELPSGWHWNTPDLYQNILQGLKKAAETYGDAIVSLGIDTWGVDYGLVDNGGRLLGLPYQYRDSRTDDMMELAYDKVGKQAIYEATGIQFMFFNSLFQLLSEVESKNPAITAADEILFMPDLLGYWLTGNQAQELSIVSTTQLYNPKKKDWDFELIDKLGLPKQIFKEITQPGTELGRLRKSVSQSTKLNPQTKVITVAGHDTASAVAAVPSQSKTPAYLSSGTWSLMGLELPEPVINDQSFKDAFTNEMGVGGAVRFLKNICGLWLIQESRRYWLDQGTDIVYSQMASLAGEAEPFRSLINPDDEVFASAGDMPVKIRNYCREHGQPIPETHGEIIRCIYESLALKYAEVWEKLVQYAPEKPDTLHIVGGGCQDKMLNQFTADAIGVRVMAGPVEATGLGNILAQLMAEGSIKDLASGRQIISESASFEIFEPQETSEWQVAKESFKLLN